MLAHVMSSHSPYCNDPLGGKTKLNANEGLSDRTDDLNRLRFKFQDVKQS